MIYRYTILLLLTLLLAGCNQNPKPTTHANRMAVAPITKTNNYTLLDKKVALIIGNQAYEYTDAWSELKTPINDAKAVREALLDIGFKEENIIYKENLTQHQFNSALRKFYEKVGKNGLGFIYYAGHGISINGKNYYIPVNAQCIDKYSTNSAIALNGALVRQEEDRPKLMLLALDACRSTPGSKCASRGSEKGPNSQEKLRNAEGVIIQYSTQDGSVADDSKYADKTDGHSIYSYHLIQTLRKPVEIKEIFSQTAKAVREETQSRQRPCLSAQDISGSYFFLPPEGHIEFTSNKRGTITLNNNRTINYTTPGVAKRINVVLGKHTMKFTPEKGRSKTATKTLSLYDRSGEVNFYYERISRQESDMLKMQQNISNTSSNNKNITLENIRTLYADKRTLAQKDSYTLELLETVAKKDYTAKNNQIAGYNLAMIYLAQEREKEAFALLKELSKRKDADAKIYVGLAGRYYYGEGTKQDYKKAFEWVSKAAELGDASAINRLGLMYAKGLHVNKDETKAVEYYKQAAEMGNAVAQNNLGYIYYNGKGVEQDYKKAFKWYSKAAEQGNASAINWLGVMYEKGLHVNKDEAKAVEYYKKAAEMGNAWGQKNLGSKYYNGKGVEQDYKKAFKWYSKAAEQGKAWGQHNLGHMYYNGKGVKQDYKKAFKWFSKAAEQGNADAQHNLGHMYYNGKGVKQDYKKAFKWYSKAAEQGNADAINWLGVMYAKGLHVNKDEVKAIEYYKKAAEMGNAWGQNNLGSKYYNGKGVKQDYKKAFEWFSKAAEQGNADAISWLGYMYEKGLHVNKDEAKAVEYYKKAAAKGDKYAKKQLKRLKEH